MRSRSTRIIKREKFPSKNIFILLALVVFGLFFYFFINSNEIANFVHSKNSEEKLISPKSLAGLMPSPIPTFTPTPTEIPTPTLTPTPTPVPLVGYCLNVPVLIYHHVEPQAQAKDLNQTSLSVDNGMFDHQMEYLKSSGYTTITVKQLIDALITHQSLLPKSIAITLDDGYKDVYDYAYPVFKKYNITANLMIATGLLEGGSYISWSQLQDMYSSGLIYVTDHTWSHYAINNGSNDKIKYEIEIAKKQLENRLGQSVNIFTYPYGAFNNNAINILKQDGFIGAFSTIPGFWQCDSFIMALHRNRVGNAPLSEYGL